MDTLRLVLLLLHIFGYAALLGGLLIQMKEGEKKVNSLMRDGAGTAFVTGVLLVGILEGLDAPIDHSKIGLKFAVALIVLILVMANLRKSNIPTGLWAGILALTVINIVAAVFWSPTHKMDEDAAEAATAPAVVVQTVG